MNDRVSACYRADVIGNAKPDMRQSGWRKFMPQGEIAMEKRVSKAVFKSKACELFRQVERLGESVVVTDRGEPTIEIRPYRSRRKNPLDALRASILHSNLNGQGELTVEHADKR
ncbi:type II toxin-antitoxin system Phd/YefM family antitoxin [Paraburkholderia caballeronis]